MRFGTAIERLVDNYQYAKSKIWIRDEVAWALYHTWKEADDRKTEPTQNQHIQSVESVGEDRKTEPLTCDGNCWMKKQFGEWLCEHCQRKPKTEPNCSEIPNNCEHITEDGVTCAKYPACDDCLDNPLNKVKGSERLVKSSEQTEPTISKMEQVETMSCAECKHRPIGAEICEEPCHYEPQTERSRK